MKFKKLLIIPDKAQLPEYEALAQQYQMGFEYNDFFVPKLLDDKESLLATKQIYHKSDKLPEYCTMHGAFLDVTVFSDDPMIVKASDYRVEQSLSIAEELGAKGVIFHTNYIANFKTDSYREQFVSRNAKYWSEKLDAHKNLNLYIENMFDDTPELLARLADALSDKPNFGVCLDYAHAHVFGNPEDIETWVTTLAPYVRHIHINDNDFKQDSHLAIGEGRIDWKRFLYYYDTYFSQATVLLEMRGIDKIKRSLSYLNLL